MKRYEEFLGTIFPFHSFYNYDVFISYSHDEANWVRETLLPKLENHGYSVIIDFRDFQGGNFSVEEMQVQYAIRRNLFLSSVNFH